MNCIDTIMNFTIDRKGNTMNMMNKIGIALAAVLMIVLIGCSAENADAQGKINLTLGGIDGTSFTLDDFKGQPVLIDIWDTWCPPCRRGIPDFIELYKEYKGKGLVIIGIALGQEGKAAVQAFMKEYGINYPIALANDDVMKILGPIESIPTAFLLNKKHHIVKKYVGLQEKSEFAGDIQDLL